MFSQFIPNIDIFIHLHITKEATQSSKIEGTKTDLKEAIQSENQIKGERRDDWIEVQNYVSAMNMAIEHLEKLPISSRLIKITHKAILKGARGHMKEPGEFRKSQNWIGGASINSATFIPPIHSELGSLMSDLEKFANNETTKTPALVKIAIIHYQFETIHPFLDGNGRVGRLLITLYLVEQKVLEKPLLYLSEFFERNRLEYYNRLMAVRENGVLIGWVKFFLDGVIQTAESSIKTLESILILEKATNEKVNSLKGKAENAQKIIQYLYKKPIIEVAEVAKIIGFSKQSAYKLVENLEKVEILTKWGTKQKPQLYVFDQYLSLFLDD